MNIANIRRVLEGKDLTRNFIAMSLTRISFHRARSSDVSQLATTA